MDELSFGDYTGADVNGNTTDTPDDDDDSNVYLTIAVIECIFVAVGAVGNTMLFILMQSKRMKRYSFSVYFSFAAVFNTLSIFWNALQDTYEVANVKSLEESVGAPWSFGCGVVELLDGLLLSTSTWVMMFLSFDRYVSICHPLRAEMFCRRIIAFIICTGVVLISFVFSLPWSLMKGSSTSHADSDGPVLCSDEPMSDTLNLAADVLFILLPVCVISICNVLILFNLQKKRSLRLEENATHQGDYISNLNKFNMAIFYLLIVTFLTWLPYTILTLREDIMIQQGDGQYSGSDDYAWHSTEVIWFLPFVQDFYLLMLLSPIYRHEFKLQCFRLPCCNPSYEQGLGEEDEPVSSNNMKDEGDI